MLVVLVHAQMLVRAYEQRYGLSPAWLNSFESLRDFGQCGVDIFFVISGFVMAYITYGKHHSPGAVRDFLKRRIVRIVPLYWFYTSILALLLFFVPQLFSRATFELHGLVLSYLFIPYVPTAANMSPVLSVGWTLTYEMYFYVLVALGLFISRRQFLLALGCLFAASVSMHFQAEGPVAKVLTNPLLLEFYAGYVIGSAYAHGFKLPTGLAWGCILLSLFLFYAWLAGWGTYTRAVSWGVPSALLVAGAVFLERNMHLTFPRGVMALGDSSYSLYLSHFLFLPGIGKAAAKLGIAQLLPPDVLILLITACCCVGGYISYRVLEMPTLRFLSKVKLPARGEQLSTHNCS